MNEGEMVIFLKKISKNLRMFKMLVICALNLQK